MEEERTTEIRRGGPPPWYEEHWWIFLIVLLLIVGAIVAYFALRDRDDAEPVGTVTTVQETQTETATPTETETETETQTETQTQTETETQAETETVPQEGVAMPDLRGVEHQDAVEELLDAGLFPNTFPVQSQEERGNVVDQRPGPGARVPSGSSVRLDVSLGTGERPERDVPDLVGLSPAQALEDCARAGFTCRLVSAGAQRRPVTSQQPAAGTAAPELRQIRLSQE